jgi:hypothetical protein
MSRNFVTHFMSSFTGYAEPLHMGEIQPRSAYLDGMRCKEEETPCEGGEGMVWLPLGEAERS